MANTALFNVQFDSNSVEFASQIKNSMTAAQRSAEKLVNKLKVQEAALKLGQKAADEMSLSMLNLENAQLQEIAALQRSIAAEQEKAESLRQQKIAEDMRQKEMDQSRMAIGAMILALEEENLVLREGTNALMMQRAVQKGATLDDLARIKSLQNLNNTLKQTTGGMQAGARGARQFSAMGGQLGHQVQDVAVQLQMGTSAAIVFAQQGSQVAAIFGARGAMLGGLLAVGAALYTYMDASAEARKEVEKLTDALDEQIKKKKELTNAERAYLAVQYKNELKEQKKQLDVLEKKHEDATKKLNKHKSSMAEFSRVTNGGSDIAMRYSTIMANGAFANIQNKDSVDELTDTLEQYGAMQEYISNIEKELQRDKDLVANGYNPAVTRSVEDQVKALKEQNKTYGMTTEQAELYKVISSEIPQEIKNAYVAEWNLAQARKAQAEETETARKKQEEYIDALWKADNAIFDTFEAYDMQLELLGKTWIQQELLKASKKGLTDADLADLEVTLKKIEAKKEELAVIKNLNKAALDASNASFDKQDQAITDFEALKDKYKTEAELLQESENNKLAIIKKALDTGLLFEGEAEALRKKIRDESAANAIMVQQQQDIALAEGAKGLVDTMAMAFDKSSGLGKAFYVASQVMNAGLAIMNAEAASVAILKNAATMGMPLPAAQMQANMARMQGYMSAGIIMGQTLASFEGGGYTPSGARSGGVDGKGGFLATLHPNEKITDLTKQTESQPVSVNFTINAVDSKGVDRLLAERQGMIVSMVNRAMNNNGKRGVV